LPPPVPVMVIVYVPAGVVAAVEIFRLEVKAGVPEVGVKLAVAPSGSPDAWRATVLVKSFMPVIWTVVVVDWPCSTVPVLGLTDMVKSGMGAAVTVSV